MFWVLNTFSLTPTPIFFFFLLWFNLPEINEAKTQGQRPVLWGWTLIQFKETFLRKRIQKYLTYFSFFTKAYDHVNIPVGPLYGLGRNPGTWGALKLKCHQLVGKNTSALLPCPMPHPPWNPIPNLPTRPWGSRHPAPFLEKDRQTHKGIRKGEAT